MRYNKQKDLSIVVKKKCDYVKQLLHKKLQVFWFAHVNDKQLQEDVG